MERANSQSRKVFEAPILTRQRNCYLVCQVFFLSLTTNENVAGKKRQSGDTQHRALAVGAQCAGCVYGCALGNLVNYCAHTNSNIPSIMRKIHEVLVPIASAVLTERGVDSQILCSGIAAHRIARSQQLRLAGEIEKNIHCRQANPAIVLGLTASIYCVYSVLSCDSVTITRISRAPDVAWFVENSMLLKSLKIAKYILESSTPPQHGVGSAPEFEIAAHEAEFRAVERAIQGVETATLMATKNDLDTLTTFSMQLAFFQKSAWPTNERLGPDTQNALLEKIASPLFFTCENQQASHASQFPHPGLVVPLSQLSGIGSRSNDEKCTESDNSSIATGSSLRQGSNPSSSGASSIGSELDVGPFLSLVL